MRPIQILLTRLQRELSKLGRTLRGFAEGPFRILRQRRAGPAERSVSLPFRIEPAPDPGDPPLPVRDPAPCLHFAPPPPAWRRPRLRAGHGAEDSAGPERPPLRDLPPIRPAEIAELDLDGLLHRLLDDRSAAEPGDRT